MPETFNDGDNVLGLIVRFTDEKLLCGFRLSSSQRQAEREQRKALRSALAFC
jgi:hypothetical protein